MTDNPMVGSLLDKPIYTMGTNTDVFVADCLMSMPMPDRSALSNCQSCPSQAKSLKVYEKVTSNQNAAVRVECPFCNEKDFMLSSVNPIEEVRRDFLGCDETVVQLVRGIWFQDL